ncbi:MAG: lysozyme [Sphingomonadales bacterium]|nr:lysozyme [Sphingomonadales bacterium]
MARPVNDAGIRLICSFEGLKLNAYPDPGTGGAPWTIGYGHTAPDVVPGMAITREQAVALLRGDLAVAAGFVEHVAPVASDNQFAALASFAYNCGRQNLRTSTLLRKHNAGDHAGAAREFGKWVNAAGKPLAGLVRRRAAEAALYGR